MADASVLISVLLESDPRLRSGLLRNKMDKNGYWTTTFDHEELGGAAIWNGYLATLRQKK